MQTLDPILLTVDEPSHQMRLDQFLAQSLSQYSRGQHQTWIKQQHVEVNAVITTRCRQRVSQGDSVVLQPEYQDKTAWQPHAHPLDIVYEDTAILIINKPSGLVMHPGAGKPVITLANALLDYDSTLHKVPRAGIVHRLDKNTTGLCVVAKTPEAAYFLTQQLKKRHFQRHYLTIVHGQVFCSGHVETHIDRHPSKRTQMAVTPQGRHAVTHYTIRKKFQHNTLLDVTLETGRTHQIRVHMAHLQHPVCGDPTYNKPTHHYTHLPKPVLDAIGMLNRQALHAYKLTIPHPESLQNMTWESPLPQDMAAVLTQLEAHQALEYLDPC